MKILQRIIWKNFKQAKVRNIISVFAIIITSMFSTMFFLIGDQVINFLKDKMQNIWSKEFFDAITALGLYIGIPVIVCIGYLILYNSFQNSVVNNVRFIGTLTAIGATSRQICFMMLVQAGILSVMAIPAGCISGVLVSKIIIRVVSNVLKSKLEITVIDSSKIIALGIGLTLFTVIISILRPVVKAGNLSIISSTNYIDISESALKNRTCAKKSTPISLAWRNIRRSFWRVDAIVVFLALGLFLVNTTISIYKGVSSQRYIESSLDTDFVVGSKAYMQPGLGCFYSNSFQVSKDLVQKIEKSKGIIQGGSLYYAGSYIGQEKSRVILDNITVKTNKLPEVDPFLGEPILADQNGNYPVELYGGDNFVLSQLEVVEGEIDLEKMKEGNSIIIILPNYEQAKCDQVCKEADYYQIGEKITLVTSTGEHQYEIAAKCNNKIKKYIMGWEPSGSVSMFYLPTQEFKNITKNYARVRYFFNVKKENLKAYNKMLSSYTNKIDKEMEYISRQTLKEEVVQNEIVYFSIGILLSIIAGLVGFLNLINSIITTILQRKNEFSILESIGMTQKQIQSMLVWEGFFYGIISIMVGTGISVFVSVIYLKDLFRYWIWFYEYQLVVWPLLVVAVAILMVGISFPVFVYQIVKPQKIVSGIKEE